LPDETYADKKLNAAIIFTDEMSPKPVDFYKMTDQKVMLQRPLISLDRFLVPKSKEIRIPDKFADEFVCVGCLVPKARLDENEREPDASGTFGYQRIKTKLRACDMKDYIKKKSNANLGIIGTAGNGKSVLARGLLRLYKEEQTVYLSFKSNDHALRMGIPVIDVSQSPPDPFQDPPAFARSYFSTFFKGVKNTGIQLQQTTSILMELAEQCKGGTWTDFMRAIQAKKKTASKNQKETLSAIEQNAKSLILIGFAGTINIGEESRILDFSRILSEEAQNFWAELYLTQFWNQLQTNRRKGLIICVDEAHRLRSPFSIIVPMSKQVRHIAKLWLITQNLFEIQDEVRPNLATKFAFGLGDVDLGILREYPMIREAVSRVDQREFVDIEFPRRHEFVPIFHYKATGREDDLKTIWVKAPQPSAAVVIEQTKVKASEQVVNDARILALSMLEEKPISVSELTRKFTGEKSGQRFVVAKRDLFRPTLIEIKNDDDLGIDSERFDFSNKERKDGVFHVKFTVLYYKHGKEEFPRLTQLHIWQQNWTALEYKRAGYTITDEARPDEKNDSKPDLVVEKSGKRFCVEIETGLKNGKIVDLKKRVARNEEEGKTTIIVVPNNETRETYTAIFPKSIVTCFYPFINSLKSEGQQQGPPVGADEMKEEKEGQVARGEREEEGSEARTGREENNG